MSQHDYVIANDTAANVRADINSALAAIVSNNSGATAPATAYANQFWYDTTTKILKIRTESNDAWVSIAYLDDAANAFRLLDDTQVVNTSGVQTGLLGDQLTATWQAGTGTTPSLVSPANIKSAINALALTSTSALPAANLTGALPAIDGSALTGVSAASGVQTFTATGALANGDLVGLNADGTVSVVSPYSLQTTTANAVASAWISSTFDTLNNKVVVFYQNASVGNNLNAVVGTISGSTISFGTPVVVLSSNCLYTSCIFDTLNNKVVVATYDFTTNITKAFVGTVSGTTISFGTAATIATAGFFPSITFDSINNKVVAVYVNGSPYQVYSKVGTVSGTTISFGTQATVAAASTSGYPTDITFSAATGKVVVLYSSSTYFATLAVGTVSGTTISYGTSVEISDSSFPTYGSLAYDSATGSVVLSYTAASGVRFLVCTISGTSISLGTSSLLALASATYQKLIGIGDSAFVYACHRSGFFYRIIIKTDGVTVKPITASQVDGFGNNSNASIGLAFDPVNKLVAVSYRGPSPSYLATDLTNPLSPTITWVGIAAEAIANGASGKITTTGGINSGQTGLLTGAPYGYDTNIGALTLGGDNLGYAVSPTQLYIK